MYRGFTVTAPIRASKCFTVNRDQLTIGDFVNDLHPVNKAGSKLVSVNP